jgi:hypothetical protein
MARRPYATQINLGFGNSPREFMNFQTGVRSANFSREGLNLVRKYAIRKDW